MSSQHMPSLFVLEWGSAIDPMLVKGVEVEEFINSDTHRITSLCVAVNISGKTFRSPWLLVDLGKHHEIRQQANQLRDRTIASIAKAQQEVIKVGMRNVMEAVKAQARK